jgi:hypothetical protein
MRKTITQNKIRRYLRFLSGLPVRGDNVGGLLDVFIVLAVGTILVVRVFLWLIGYPQIGGGKFHIAHMLWGGLLMMAGLIFMQSIITRWARRVGAVLGGIGFGLFIDELGKFITKDNDYFYKPTYAILYVLFILLYLLTRHLLRSQGLTAHESLVNAIDYVKEGAAGELEENSKRKALALIAQAEPQNPFTTPIHELLEQVRTISDHSPFFWERMAQWGREHYRRWVATKTFARVIAALFLGVAIFNLLDIPFQVLNIFELESFSFTNWAVLISSTLSTIFVVIGDVQLLRRRHLSAYRWFDRALLVSILVVQVFVFARIQLIGVLKLAILLLLLVTVRYLIVLETNRKLVVDAKRMKLKT